MTPFSTESEREHAEVERIREAIRLLKLALEGCYTYLAEIEEKRRRGGN